METIQAVVLEQLTSIAHQQFNSTDLTQLPIIVAYSGGLDSSVLLHVCHQLKQQGKIAHLAAAHVNHGIQPLNDSWEQHCIEQCEQYQIDIQCKQFSLSKGKTVSENKARQARYQFFEYLLATPAVLLFAHHLDDQVETMLFRMIRGTGVHGLSGILKLRQLASGWLARPLLECSRPQLEQYAKRFTLNWVEDPSNQKNLYSRNYLRNKVIPNIESKWPEFSRSFKQLSEVASEQNLLLDEVAAQDVKTIKQANSSLKVKEFNQLSKVRRKNLLHYWVRFQTENSPSSTEINEAVKQLENLSVEIKKDTGASSIKVKLGQGWLRSYDKHVYYCLGSEPAQLNGINHWEDYSKPLVLDNGVRLEFAKAKEPKADTSLFIRHPKPTETVTVRARQGGEIAKPSYRSHSADLKKIFQELKVPPWKRKWLPVVYFDQKIACIPGVFVDKAFRDESSQIQLSILIDSECDYLDR